MNTRNAYVTSRNDALQDEIKDLAETLGKDVEELYNHILFTALCKYAAAGSIFPVTVVMKDVRELRKSKPQDADLLTDLICDPLQTYENLAKQYGIERNLVHYRITQYAKHFPWLRSLMELKSWYFYHGYRSSKRHKK